MLQSLTRSNEQCLYRPTADVKFDTTRACCGPSFRQINDPFAPNVCANFYRSLVQIVASSYGILYVEPQGENMNPAASLETAQTLE
jgi:hypothetical protein